MDESAMNTYKIDLESKLKELEARFGSKVEQSFNDFVLKIEGELTRRNRLRIETNNKFETIDKLL